MRIRKKKYSEEELLQGCKDNLRHFQKILYLQYFDTMVRMCRRFTSQNEEAVDIVNNGFLKVFKKIQSYESRGSLEGWIRRCVYNCLCDYYRKKNRDIRFLEMEEYRSSTLSNMALPNLYLEDLMHLVNNLPEMSKKVFVLFTIEGYTHKEIGDLLSISEGTSKWHVSTARKKLRALIRTNDDLFSQLKRVRNG